LAVSWIRLVATEERHGASGATLAIRPNLFQQNVPENTIPSIDAQGTFYLNAGDARISMVDTRDVGAVAAVVLSEPGYAGAAYDVTGPEALSYQDVAAKLAHAMHRPITYVDAADQAVLDALLGFGIDHCVGRRRPTAPLSARSPWPGGPRRRPSA
jgi:uncharacterized protein YbjT (DUF2867 family)